jgi:hypothetical protein
MLFAVTEFNMQLLSVQSTQKYIQDDRGKCNKMTDLASCNKNVVSVWLLVGMSAIKRKTKADMLVQVNIFAIGCLLIVHSKLNLAASVQLETRHAYLFANMVALTLEILYQSSLAAFLNNFSLRHDDIAPKWQVHKDIEASSAALIQTQSSKVIAGYSWP